MSRASRYAVSELAISLNFGLGSRYTALINSRTPNADERRRQLCDAAIELLAERGARGLTHLKVDRRAGVADGTTSAYYRTRAALLYGVAARIVDLDMAELTSVAEESSSAAVPNVTPGTSEIGRLIMRASSSEGLTRTRARYELLLLAARDPDIAKLFHENTIRLIDLSRRAVAQWFPVASNLASDIVEDQVAATLAFVDGVLMSFVRGTHAIRGPEQFDSALRAIVTGITSPTKPTGVTRHE